METQKKRYPKEWRQWRWLPNRGSEITPLSEIQKFLKVKTEFFAIVHFGFVFLNDFLGKNLKVSRVKNWTSPDYREQ